MTATRTYAVMEVSRPTYDEVAERLREAGYDHAFVADDLDMRGVALRARPGDEVALGLSLAELNVLAALVEERRGTGRRVNITAVGLRELSDRLREVLKSEWVPPVEGPLLAKPEPPALCWPGSRPLDLTVGRLDRTLSEFLIQCERGDLDEADRRTLKHHCDDLVGVGKAGLERLRLTRDRASLVAELDDGRCAKCPVHGPSHGGGMAGHDEDLP